MKKILILIIFSSSFLFSITSDECKAEIIGAKVTVLGTDTGVTRTGMTRVPSPVCGSSANGVSNGQAYAGFYRSFSNWRGNFLGGDVDYETTYFSVCTQEDIPLTSPNGGSESGWIIIGNVTCNTDGYSAEAEEFYNNLDSAFRTMTTSMTDCCSATDYYIKEDLACPLPTRFDFSTASCEIPDSNVTCPEGKEINSDNECVIPLSCPTDYQIFENLSAESTSCATISPDNYPCYELVPFGASQPQAFCVSSVLSPTDKYLTKINHQKQL